MDFEETRRLEAIEYDEKTESWFVQVRDAGRVPLSREWLLRLVRAYNSIHKGNQLVLLEQRELRRIEETRQRNSEILRDLYLFLDRKERRRPVSVLKRWYRRLARSLRGSLRGRRS